MLGAGIFAAAGPAASAAGSGLLIGTLIAGALAYLNAISMSQLAAIYPESGGTYVYGRKQLGELWGFLAGWAFVIGKIASCTAMALTFAHYALPAYSKWLAIASVLLLSLVNYRGIRKTSQLTKVLLLVVLLSLTAVVIASLTGGGAKIERLSHWTDRGGLLGIFQSAGIMFFAFAGYARIATLGEEVIDPKKNIPRAILQALGITLIIYLVIISVLLLSVDIDALVQSTAPLALAVESGRYAYFSPIVRIGASFASLGVLVSLMAGVSRTVFAMSANRDLPHFLSSVHPKHKVPHHAELSVGFVITMMLLFSELEFAIAFSSFAILLYYAVANAACFSLDAHQRRWPKWMAGLGFLACVMIAFSLPTASIMGGMIFLALGLGIHFFRRRNSQTT